MAPGTTTLLPNDAVEVAITRVLKAEAAARDAVSCTHREAAEIAEQAREQARRLGLHTDLRIHTVRAAFDAKVKTKVAALEAQTAALGTANDLTPAEVSSVERAVAALACALTADRA